MNIETARALVDEMDAGAYELSEALEWALDELEGGEAVSACLPPGSRSAEVMQAYNEGAVISIGDMLHLAAEVDELRADRDLWRWRCEHVVASFDPGPEPQKAGMFEQDYQRYMREWRADKVVHAAALEIMTKENE